jgi:hypothetical protein
MGRPSPIDEVHGGAEARRGFTEDQLRHDNIRIRIRDSWIAAISGLVAIAPMAN